MEDAAHTSVSVQSVNVASSENTPAVIPLPITNRVWARQMVAVAAGLGMFLSALDISVNVALPNLTRDLNTDLQTVQWIIVVYVASRAALVMSAGSFADRFGLRRVYIFGAVMYLVAMVCIGVSPNLWMVVGFRALQALGSGSLFAVSPAIAARLFPVSRRGMAMGFTTGCQALGAVAGTIGAGLLVNWGGWEMIFLGRVPFILLALVLGVWWMSRDPRSQRGSSFDIPGAVTLGVALLCLVVGLRLGRSVGWLSPVVLALLVLAPVLLTLFWRIEGRAPWPVLPRGLLRVPGFVIPSAASFTAQLGVFVIWFIFPFYIGDVIGRDAVSMGTLFAVMAVLQMASSSGGGWLCDRVGPIWVGTTGVTVITLGMVYLGFLTATSTLLEIGLGIAIIGAGMGSFQAAAYTYMMSSVATERLSTAASALSLCQSSGTVLSVAVMGGAFALFQSYYRSGFGGEGVSAGGTETDVFMLAFRALFWVGAGLTAVSGGIFLWGRWMRPAETALN